MGHLADEFVIGERLGFLLKQKALIFASQTEIAPEDKIYFIGNLDGQLPIGVSEWPVIAYNPATVLDYVKETFKAGGYNKLIEVSTDVTLHPKASVISVQTF